MKTPRLLAVMMLAAGLLLSLQPRPARAADPEIVQRLEQIVQLRQLEAELQRQLAPKGQSDEGLAEIALCRARIDLARELAQPGDVMVQLQQILAVRQAGFQRAKATLPDTIGTRQTLRKLEIEILQAEIDIRREQAR